MTNENQTINITVTKNCDIDNTPGSSMSVTTKDPNSDELKQILNFAGVTNNCDVCDENPCVCDAEFCGTCASAPCVCPEASQDSISAALADLVKLSGGVPVTVKESTLVEVTNVKAPVLDALHRLGSLMLDSSERLQIKGARENDPKIVELNNLSRIGEMLVHLGEPFATPIEKFSKPDLDFVAHKLNVPYEKFMKIVGIREGVEMQPYQEENDLEPMSKEQVMGDQPLVNNTGDNSMVDSEHPEKKLSIKTVKEHMDFIKKLETIKESFEPGDEVRVVADHVRYGDMDGEVLKIEDDGDVLVKLADFGDVKLEPSELHKNHNMLEKTSTLMQDKKTKNESSYASEDHIENAIGDALNNFDMQDFLEHCGNDFGWKSRDSEPAEDKEYTNQYVLSSLVGYIKHWIEQHRDEEIDVETTDVSRLFKEEVLPYLTNSGYTIKPELKVVESDKNPHHPKEIARRQRRNREDNEENLKEKSEVHVEDGDVEEDTEEKLKESMKNLGHFSKLSILETLKEHFTYGDKVEITGDKHHHGDVGEVVSFDKSNDTVVVDLQGHGRHSFPISSVEKYDIKTEKNPLTDFELTDFEKEFGTDREFDDETGQWGVWKNGLFYPSDDQEIDEGNAHDELRADPSDHDTLMHKNIEDVKHEGILDEVGSSAFLLPKGETQGKEIVDKILKLDDKNYIAVCHLLFDKANVYKPHDKIDILAAIKNLNDIDFNKVEKFLQKHEDMLNDKEHVLSMTEEENLSEKAPPGMEDWVKANKAKFKKEYGKDEGEKVLYAKAWEKYNESIESLKNKLNEEFKNF